MELIKKLWGIAWDLWEHRNGILHEQQNAVSHASIKALDGKVTEAYATLHNLMLSMHDRHLISLNIARLLKKDQLYKESWLSNALPVISGRNKLQWNKRQANERMMQGMQLRMRRCLQRRTFRTTIFNQHTSIRT